MNGNSEPAPVPVAGEQLDCAVCEKVLGLCAHLWTWAPHEKDEEGNYIEEWSESPTKSCKKCGVKAWGLRYQVNGPPDVAHYSSNIEAAWRVIERLQGQFHWRLTSPFQPDQPWFAGVTPHGTSGWNGRPDIEAGADTAALAICLCSLKAAALNYDGLSVAGESLEEVAQRVRTS